MCPMPKYWASCADIAKYFRYRTTEWSTQSLILNQTNSQYNFPLLIHWVYHLRWWPNRYLSMLQIFVFLFYFIIFFMQLNQSHLIVVEQQPIFIYYKFTPCKLVYMYIISIYIYLLVKIKYLLVIMSFSLNMV